MMTGSCRFYWPSIRERTDEMRLITENLKPIAGGLFVLAAVAFGARHFIGEPKPPITRIGIAGRAT